MESSTDEVTQLLLAWSNGDQTALEKLVPLVENELRRLAGHFLRREPPSHELETTELVNEAYIRLVDMPRVRWQNRAHFFAVAAQIMRRILLDYARTRHRVKRGGAAEHIPLESAQILPAEKTEGLLALDEALNRLAQTDEVKSRVVELRYFGGLTVEETAEVLGLSPSSVSRHWRLAQSWLRQEFGRGELTESDASTYAVFTESDASTHAEQPEVATEAEESERTLAEAWSNRELVATLMEGNWAGLKLLAQLRLNPNAGEAELASAVGAHVNIVASLLFRFAQLGALEERHNIFTLTSRGDVLLKNFEEAIGKNL
jgi:RNA polymerase sigma-70 factor, ECF subfamily